MGLKARDFALTLQQRPNCCRVEAVGGGVRGLVRNCSEDAAKTIRAYQDLLSGKSDAFDLLEQVQALEKLGVTEGTLAEL